MSRSSGTSYTNGFERLKGIFGPPNICLRWSRKIIFVTAFHAQQAAEKFLKAFLVRHQIPFPKTHDIGFLLELAARADPSLQEELASAAMLTPFGVAFRYPGETVADREATRSALQEAHRVKAAVQRRLQAYLAQGRPSGWESA